MPPKNKPPAQPITTQQIAGTLQSVLNGIEELLAQRPEEEPEVNLLLLDFITSPIYEQIMGSPPPRNTPEAPPHPVLEDIKSIKASIAALEKAIRTGQQPSKPSQTPKNDSSPQQPKDRAKGKTSPPSFANVAASPPRPSVVVNLAHMSWDPRPSAPEICTDINNALRASDNDQIRISAARWTAKENLILTGGPNTTAQQLQQATLLIRQHIATAYQPIDNPTPPSLPSVRPNVKWSKLLINSVPTGVTTSRTARSPEECHAALTSDNPSYASLNITQKPSWVKNPTSYPVGAVSSLVVAFEDPDGSLARGLMANKVLYIFGSCATIRKWKQRPTKKDNTHTPADNPPPPSNPTHKTTDHPGSTAPSLDTQDGKGKRITRHTRK
jgi:hypothetical protein